MPRPGYAPGQTEQNSQLIVCVGRRLLVQCENSFLKDTECTDCLDLKFTVNTNEWK